MELQKKILVPPESFSVETVTPLWKEIENLDKQQPIEIDFSNTRQLDSSAVAFVNHLKNHHPNTTLKNLDSQLEHIFAMFPGREKIPAPPKQTQSGLQKIINVTRAVGHKVGSLDDNFDKLKENYKKFFVLLADEFYYTFQFLLKRRGIYPGETWNQLFFMAYKSYPIVALISFLVGITISVTSAEQLRNFGADIYLADLVGFGMIRELVPLMTGIILAGKIGASITAEIASMKVMEETDALKTMGIVPEKFLMVPRLLAITMAIPLLVAIADFIGIAGGFLVGKVFSGIPPIAFFNEMMLVVGLEDFLIGMGKTMVFGWIIVISSGFKGFSVERGATGVGIATTESVVLSISLIIIFDCVFALILY
ncbi:MAG: hypothetical protein GY765_02280 [bacterium]|nr:hypothetical protein [bacterium]